MLSTTNDKIYISMHFQKHRLLIQNKIVKTMVLWRRSLNLSSLNNNERWLLFSANVFGTSVYAIEHISAKLTSNVSIINQTLFDMQPVDYGTLTHNFYNILIMVRPKLKGNVINFVLVTFLCRAWPRIITAYAGSRICKIICC